MKWCRFARQGQVSFGRIADEQVIAIEGTPLGEYRESGEVWPLASVRLLPPIIPPTFYAAGVNYRAHILEAQQRGSTVARIPDRAEIGYRAQSALIGPLEAIVKPADYEGSFDAEPELVAVIGRDLRRCSRDEAAAGIFGWTIGNDVSARAWQYVDRTFWRSKNSDTFKPMGPWIETEVDPMQSKTRVRVNGRQVTEFATGEMIFDVLDYMVETCRYITLRPGDVLWMGSDGNVRMAVGDTIAIEITGIGVLENPVVQGD
jgi:2-keto-4-pentenoate hydratase/2-oxohepta-3-ene-1,7-dioic acid hydratase in catechol pathway